MRPWNPQAQTFHGEAITGVVPVGLVVDGPQLTPAQSAMAQAAYVSFCASARLTVFQNAQEHGVLPDGSPFQITLVAGVAKMKVRTSAVEDPEVHLSGIGVTYGGTADLQAETGLLVLQFLGGLNTPQGVRRKRVVPQLNGGADYWFGSVKPREYFVSGFDASAENVRRIALAERVLADDSNAASTLAMHRVGGVPYVSQLALTGGYLAKAYSKRLDAADGGSVHAGGTVAEKFISDYGTLALPSTRRNGREVIFGGYEMSRGGPWLLGIGETFFDGASAGITFTPTAGPKITFEPESPQFVEQAVLYEIVLNEGGESIPATETEREFQSSFRDISTIKSQTESKKGDTRRYLDKNGTLRQDKSELEIRRQVWVDENGSVEQVGWGGGIWGGFPGEHIKTVSRVETRVEYEETQKVERPGIFPAEFTEFRTTWKTRAMTFVDKYGENPPQIPGEVWVGQFATRAWRTELEIYEVSQSRYPQVYDAQWGLAVYVELFRERTSSQTLTLNGTYSFDNEAQRNLLIDYEDRDRDWRNDAANETTNEREYSAALRVCINGAAVFSHPLGSTIEWIDSDCPLMHPSGWLLGLPTGASAEIRGYFFYPEDSIAGRPSRAKTTHTIIGGVNMLYAKDPLTGAGLLSLQAPSNGLMKNFIVDSRGATEYRGLDSAVISNLTSV